jgi:LCP family protein required for cell wall assembly
LVKTKSVDPRHANPITTKGVGIKKVLFRATAIVLGASLGILGVTAFSLNNQIKANGIQLVDANGQAIKPPSTEDLKGAINILLVGSDSRQGQSSVFGNDRTVLADVIILVHISKDRKNVVAMSFPRDLIVPWPSCPDPEGGAPYFAQSMGQINATIANGGPGCTVLTVEKLTGLKIPYLAMINFQGVIDMSDAIGGVEVCLSKPLKDKYTFLNLPQGKNVLQGMKALQFLRTRHGVGDGSDLGRISNQQVFLTSLMRKIKSGGVLTNPIQLYSLANAAVRNMTLSSSLSDVGTMVSIASSIKDADLDKITFVQVPSHTGLPAPYSGRVGLTEDKAKIIFDMLKADKPILVSGTNTGYGTSNASGNSGNSGTSNTKDDTNVDWLIGTNSATTTCSG